MKLQFTNVARFFQQYSHLFHHLLILRRALPVFYSQAASQAFCLGWLGLATTIMELSRVRWRCFGLLARSETQNLPPSSPLLCGFLFYCLAMTLRDRTRSNLNLKLPEPAVEEWWEGGSSQGTCTTTLSSPTTLIVSSEIFFIF
ncbi:hypothetical protein BDN70DRAFT_325694 [Pholiota conissans]|uniref:Uncharacterized protein n=1 Tax=Pholiota conissans TaxID=109636 RepID=A0A9P5YUS7_9AGAR|nr:hypothetical protein BDN70DRAFT_325694 [Pholiota conissans]